MWITLGQLDERLHTLVVGQNRDERLEVFGTAADDTIWHTWQTAANGAWRGSFAPLGQPDERLRTLAVGQNADGRLEVFGTAADDSIWHIWQLSPGGAWHDGFVNLGQPDERLRALVVGRNADGRLEVFGTAADDTIWHTWQNAPSGGWGDCVRVHYKSVVPLTSGVQAFITQQHGAMQALYDTHRIDASLESVEDLSGDPALAPLQTFNVGSCTSGEPSQDHRTLFTRRNNARDTDVVVYIVQTLLGGAGTFLGCAVHPDGQPGAVVIQNRANWIVAHEVGHVLGLEHVSTTPASNRDFLMYENVDWTNPPPNVKGSEAATMRDSSLARDC